MRRAHTLLMSAVLAGGLMLGSAAVASAAPATCTLQGQAKMLCKDPSKMIQPRPGQKGPDGWDVLLCSTGISREKPARITWKNLRTLSGPAGGATLCLIEFAKN